MSETQMLEQRLREFAAAPDDAVDWEDVLRRAGERFSPPRLPRRRLALALAAAILVAGAVVGLFVAHGPRTGRTSSTGANGPVIPPVTPIALGDASTALGAPVVLPDASLAPASDATASEQCFPISKSSSSCHVTVSFQSQDLRIRYQRATSSDGLPYYQSVVDTNTNAEVVYICGVPALLITATPNDPDSTGSYVEFFVGGTRIVVIDQSADAATVESLAKSIIDRATANPSENLDAPPDPLSVTYNRSGGELASIAVTASPTTANASTAVEVLAAAASATPGMATGPVKIVYQEQVPLSAPSAAAPEQRPTWSGTLSPSDWNGGCQAGWRYSVVLVAVGPGTSLADLLSGTSEEQATSGKAEWDGTGWFSC